MDTVNSVRLIDTPQPGSVSQAVFVGELCDRECAELDHAGRTISTEQNSSISSPSCYGHGELRDHGHGEMPDLVRFVSEIRNARQDYCGQGELPDLDFAESEKNSSNARHCYQGHGELPDLGCFESESRNTRPNYCGHGQLPALDGSQLEQNSSNYRQRVHGHGQSPDRECFAEKTGECTQKRRT